MYEIDGKEFTCEIELREYIEDNADKLLLSTLDDALESAITTFIEDNIELVR